jgi:hypothetical protein
MEKIAVVAPIPNASIRIAVAVNPGDLRSCRKCIADVFVSICATPLIGALVAMQLLGLLHSSVGASGGAPRLLRGIHALASDTRLLTTSGEQQFLFPDSASALGVGEQPR